MIICRLGKRSRRTRRGAPQSLLFGASDGVEQKFTGQIRDSETGMDFFPARYYGSAVGRFTSPDPMNLGADLLDPQSWNAYAVECICVCEEQSAGAGGSDGVMHV